MRIAFIGHGKVGGALAGQLTRAGHDVVIADTRRDGAEAMGAGSDGGPAVLPAGDAIRDAAVVFLATPFPVTAALL